MRYQSIFREGLFAEHVALITGGGSGIGRCVAHELASLGAHAVVVGRTESKLLQVKDEIAEDGGAASTLILDIRDADAVDDAVERTLKTHGRVDLLVNNAGGQFVAPAEAISPGGLEAVVATNLFGGFYLAQSAFRRWMREHGGAVVNVLADFGRGMPGMAHSGAARAGMDNLTKTLAVEWAKAGVRVNAVAPGWIASSGLDSYDEAQKPLIKRLEEVGPAQRLGTEAEVSAAICFLLSPAAAFINGATLKVDGAASLASALWPLARVENDRPFEGFHRTAKPAILTEA